MSRLILLCTGKLHMFTKLSPNSFIIYWRSYRLHYSSSTRRKPSQQLRQSSLRKGFYWWLSFVLVKRIKVSRRQYIKMCLFSFLYSGINSTLFLFSFTPQILTSNPKSSSYAYNIGSLPLISRSSFQKHRKWPYHTYLCCL